MQSGARIDSCLWYASGCASRSNSLLSREAAFKFELALALLNPPSLALGMGMCFADHNRNSLAALAHNSLFAPLFSSLKPPRMASSRTMVSADSLHVVTQLNQSIYMFCLEDSSVESKDNNWDKQQKFSTKCCA